MKILYANTGCCRRCLQVSLTVDKMINVARLVNPDYDIYKQTGLKEGMPIPNVNAANRIVADMVQDGYYVDFVETLIQISYEGYMGRQFELKGLSNVIDSLIADGFSYDKTTGQFFENQQKQISPNWSRLRDGDERKMTVLRLDIAGNSMLVKNNSRAEIEKAYSDMRDIVNRAVTNRLGRLWTWEGDGALAVFMFGPIEKTAIFAGMEILHELYFYNKLRNPLNSPINIRLGAHIGQVRYSTKETERLKNETVKEAMVLETLAGKNALGVSYNVYISMDKYTLGLFGTEKNSRGRKYRLYKMGMEK